MLILPICKALLDQIVSNYYSDIFYIKLDRIENKFQLSFYRSILYWTGTTIGDSLLYVYDGVFNPTVRFAN